MFFSGLTRKQQKSELLKIPAEDLVKASFKVTNFFGVPKFLPTVEKNGN